MTKYSGSGWHRQSVRHSNARKYGKARGNYKTYLQNKLDPRFRIDLIKSGKRYDLTKTRSIASDNEWYSVEKKSFLANKTIDSPLSKKEAEKLFNKLEQKKHYGKAEDKKYVRKLKRRFNKLDSIPYNEISKNDLEEMQDIRNELTKLGYGDWNR